jgi:hypothetical protein
VYSNVIKKIALNQKKLNLLIIIKITAKDSNAMIYLKVIVTLAKYDFESFEISLILIFLNVGIF